jgi:pre-60S factor REI1
MAVRRKRHDYGLDLENWHQNSVYNIKRRIASLPPIPLDAFDLQIEKKVDIGEAFTSNRSSSSSDEEVSDNEGEQSASPFQCLFCSQDFASDDAGFETNLEHMCTDHGMFIPDREMVVDMKSFVGYLATEIREWHECLYCGATKPSTLSIQSHMRDKGHCLLNLDREPELLEFWESPPLVDGDGAVPEQEHPTNLSATEIRFASGKVIGSRHGAPATKKASKKRGLVASTMIALPPGSEDAESSNLPVETQLGSGRQLARRDEMSILGVSVQQRRALVLAEKKAQRSEAVARRAREWVYAKGANSQKFDQMDNQMKWGKQNHKLLPR